MHIKFLLLTNAVLTVAIDIPWASNHRFYKGDQLSSSSKHNSKSIIKKDNEELQAQKIKETKNVMNRYIKVGKEENIDPWKLSEDTDRIQFQVEGHEGPKTYLFGFDTGNGKNRQYRLEERHRDGTIKGQYGYYDAQGKLRKIQYVAKPCEGYTEIHHESNVRKIKN
ncbi:uncharacterized protein LOC117215922 [Bombus bifarius]|uniref:Uncharacterized protein LOC117215922 n=1 Tax=Bombus bifarius TaxID=103933 RepID=A0A6P8NWB3_9HYME|nr:uncharacterized protein LOC117156178 [Bombus vancouverensis nearcticus]XP_033318372.1 uncharacterized protein LOC117215922 [Bombus bifarius]